MSRSWILCHHEYTHLDFGRRFRSQRVLVRLHRVNHHVKTLMPEVRMSLPYRSATSRLYFRLPADASPSRQFEIGVVLYHNGTCRYILRVFYKLAGILHSEPFGRDNWYMSSLSTYHCPFAEQLNRMVLRRGCSRLCSSTGEQFLDNNSAVRYLPRRTCRWLH